MRSTLLVYIVLFFLGPQVMAQDKVLKSLERKLGTQLLELNVNSTDIPVDSGRIDTIWSRTVDTTIIGYVYNGQYIEVPDTLRVQKTPLPSYLTLDFVTKVDYLAFQGWILDSISREKIYYGLNDAEEASEWITHENIFFSRENMEMVAFDPSDREINRRYFSLNRKKKLRYDDPGLVPLLFDNYLPLPERFRDKQFVDERKLYYETDDVEWIWNEQRTGGRWKGGRQRVPTLLDHYNWASGDRKNFGTGAALAYLDKQLYVSQPVRNIEPFMAEAYCHWKSKQLNQQLKLSGKTIRCRLPVAQELFAAAPVSKIALSLPEYDPTENWKITNIEFRAFVDDVYDSLMRDLLYYRLQEDERALMLLDYKSYYFDLGALEYVEVNPKTREYNRQIFDLDRSVKIKWKKEAFAVFEGEIRSALSDSLPFRYEWMDAKVRAYRGTLVIDPWRRQSYYGPQSLKAEALEEPGDTLGEDLALDGYWQNHNNGFGTRDHANYQRFIRHEMVMLPPLATIPENDEIADISYEQALAYYNWKHRIDLFRGDETDDWQQFIFPSEEELERVKKGEAIVLPVRELIYDHPVFRMVVEIIPN